VPPLGGEVLTAVPVILGKPVFQRNDGILFTSQPVLNHCRRSVCGFFAKVIEPGVVFIELRRSRVKRDTNLLAGLVAGF
jgi:hypothetical protein